MKLAEVLEFARLLMEQLRPLMAKDNIDVHSFMCITSKYDG